MKALDEFGDFVYDNVESIFSVVLIIFGIISIFCIYYIINAIKTGIYNWFLLTIASSFLTSFIINLIVMKTRL